MGQGSNQHRQRYLVQPFLTVASLDLPARICVVAFSVAIPLLAALVLVNRRELSRHRTSRSRLVVWTRVVAQNLAFVGVVAGFWHIWWIAGVGMLTSGLVAPGRRSVTRCRGPRSMPAVGQPA